MMNRLLVVILLLTTLLLTTMPAQTVATENVVLQDFDRKACYSKCPCDIRGMEQACADCIKKCDEEYWKDFEDSLGKKKGN